MKHMKHYVLGGCSSFQVRVTSSCSHVAVSLAGIPPSKKKINMKHIAKSLATEFRVCTDFGVPSWETKLIKPRPLIARLTLEKSRLQICSIVCAVGFQALGLAS